MTSKVPNPHTTGLPRNIFILITKSTNDTQRHESRYARIKHDIESLPCQQDYRKRLNIPRNVGKTSTNVKRNPSF